MSYAARRNRLSLFALSVALSGCAAQRHADQMIAKATSATDAALSPMPAVDPAKGDPAIAVTDGMYFGQSVYRRRRGDDLPPRVDRVLIRSQADVDLSGFASLVTKATGIPIALNVAKPSGGAVPAVAPGGPALPPGAVAGGSRAITMPVLWDGPLAGLLDLAAARFGVDWEFRDGVLQIADEKTQTFVLHAMPTVAGMDSELATNAGSQGAGGGGGSGGSEGGAGGGNGTNGTSKINAGSKGTLDVWTDVKAALAVIVGERGRFAVTPSNGTITVTASPAILAQVGSYVRTQNAILERQVFVRVRVYAVNLAEGDDAALSFNGVFRSAAKAVGLKWSSPGEATGAGTFTASIISSTSPLAGSDLVAKALASTSQTSLITELNLSALNNRPVSKQDVRTESYVSKTAVTNSQFTSTTELIPATLSTGFTLTLLPRIISENRLMLGYALNLSSLVRLEKETTGRSFVQLPTVDSAGGMQDVLMQSGQILMLMGYVADNALDQRQGTGDAGNFLLGGSRTASAQKKRIIVTMEPVITEGGD